VLVPLITGVHKASPQVIVALALKLAARDSIPQKSATGMLALKRSWLNRSVCIFCLLSPSQSTTGPGEDSPRHFQFQKTGCRN
jgi:hypothetical protein